MLRSYRAINFFSALARARLGVYTRKIASLNVVPSRGGIEQSGDINHGDRPPLLFINKNYLLINLVFVPRDEQIYRHLFVP